ncbi:MAG: hypothetical protein IT379_21740 [Deltaproteobacteria bacterium]|nr:hypothetical protein [Deltaproteobacteria bacterium]
MPTKKQSARTETEAPAKGTTKAKPKKKAKPRVLSAKTSVRAGVMLVLGKGPVPS